MDNQPDMKISDHPEHRMPPSENYRHDNSVIFSYELSSPEYNRGQGPSKDAAENEAYQAWGPGRNKK